MDNELETNSINTQTWNELVLGTELTINPGSTPIPGSIPPPAQLSTNPQGAIVPLATNIQSPNFVPTTVGWRLNSNGVIEAVGVVLSGEISATSGAIGGFTITSTTIAGTNFTLDSSGSRITLGSSNDIIILDADDTTYRLWAGNATAASAPFSVSKAGAISATSGTIGGFTINSTKLYGSTIQTAATVGGGNSGVIMDTAGLRGYDSVLGTTFNLPTNGDAPSFASGTINETTFEISTNAVLRTSSTVGDGTANSAGVLINNTGFYATEANQSLANANVRILTDGSAYFSGTFDLGGTQITIDNTQSIQDALDAVETAGGGTVYLKPGTYTLTADISIPGGVTLEGIARDTVIIDCDSSYSVNITGTNIYSTGTISISDTQDEVVGSGTTFTSGMVGRYIYLHNAWYEIVAFTDTTHIDISPAFSGNDLSGYATYIADPNFNSTIKNLTIIGSTGSGLIVKASMEPNLVNLVVYDCGTGIDIDYVIFPKLDIIASTDNGVNLDMNFVEGPYSDYSEFSGSTSGAGIVMVSTNNGTLFNFTCNDNTGNGITATNCDKLAYISFDISRNGAKGVEFVAGCDDNQITDGQINANTSDNIKFTATSDRNSIVAVSLKNSGGYGINIAASSCDNNQIIAPAFDNNTSGTISDSGTDTSVLPQQVPTVDTFLEVVQISSADILAIHTTSKQLLPAPGSGKINIIQQVIYSFNAGSTQYTGGNDIRPEYVGDTVALVPNLAQSNITSATDTINIRNSGSAVSNTSVVATGGVNAAVELVMPAGSPAFATGDGTLTVSVVYTIADV